MLKRHCEAALGPSAGSYEKSAGSWRRGQGSCEKSAFSDDRSEKLARPAHLNDGSSQAKHPNKPPPDEQASVRRSHRQTSKPQPATAGPQKSRLKSLLAGSHKHKPRGNYFPEFLFLRIIWPPAASTSMTESLCTVPSRTAFARRLTNSLCINLLIGRAP